MRRAVILLTLISVGCARQEDARTYQLTGQVLAVKPESRQILVKHDDIHGFMPAMTMPYDVRDASILEGRAPGDLITATLKVASDGAYLSAMTKTGAAPIPEDASTTIPPAAGITLLKPGDPVPDTALTDQDGQRVTLADFKGSVVALTFIYTRCPLPQFCPLLDRRFAEVQKVVADTPSLAGKARLLSISFDPEIDRPETLRAHARKLGADPTVWRFATADEEVVDRFAARFGVNVIREKDATITHNLRTAVIGPDGRVSRILDDNAWSADDLARALTDAAATAR